MISRELQPTEITKEMQKAYLDYAMSVIVSRALPDVRDGLKPVHRRLLFAMHEMGLTHLARYAKSAKIVGETMGKYHPHGDMPIYDALVRLAQDFSMRYPLVNGQGNFGSMDGDPPAAMRYTEAKLSNISSEMLLDLDKETVDYILNFDATLREPIFLPAKLPNLLLMGSEGIAVGMATKIPPHNLNEVIDAIIFLIGKTKVKEQALDKQASLISDITVDELLNFIKGPDFPTAGAIYDFSEIKAAYSTGKGKIVIRGKAEIEDIGQGKSAVIITELPYQVNKALLVARIAELAREKKIDGISDIRDESDRHGIRVVVELKRDTVARKILNNLYKHTALQTTFAANVVALVDGVPQTLSLKTILEEYLNHRYRVVVRRSQFELKQAQARLHILEGLRIAVQNIDLVIQTIKRARDQEAAKQALITRFKLTDIQATAILDMQLRRLAALERQKIEDEYQMIRETIEYLEDLLSHPQKILTVVKNECLRLKEKYGDTRKTRVYKSKVGEFSDEDLIPNEQTVVTITKTGYIKRQSLQSFRMQHRGGKGVLGMRTKEEDLIEHFLIAQTHDMFLIFTNRGRVFQLRVFEILESARTSRGQAIVNLINIEQGELIESILAYPPITNGQKLAVKSFVFMATRKGTVKKSPLTEFANIRKTGIVAIKLDKDDELVWTRLTNGEDDILLATRSGKAIRFSEKAVRSMGRATTGVRGMRLKKDDEVISADVISTGTKADLLVIMENGLGKKTLIQSFSKQGRGGQGVKVAKVSAKTGKVVLCQMIPQTCLALIITSLKGQVVKLAISDIPRRSRATQGVILMRFSDKNDRIAAAACVS